jgi:hypothetical protein
MEARDGIKPPSKALQTLPVSGSAPSLTILVASGIEEMRAAILHVPFHKVPPPKESMKEFLENRGLKRAYCLRQALQ